MDQIPSSAGNEHVTLQRRRRVIEEDEFLVVYGSFC